jgi:5-hydroxyisourate hydrolase
MGKLTTHVLDTSTGVPAKGIEIRLYRLTGRDTDLIKTVKTNSDGRCDSPLLDGVDFLSGGYELEFDVEDYFIDNGTDCHFLKDVVVRFYVKSAEQNYHVPLLISPFSYSTYRGS